MTAVPLTLQELAAIDECIQTGMSSAEPWETTIRGWVWQDKNSAFECKPRDLPKCLRQIYSQGANFVSMELCEAHFKIRCLPVVAAYSSWHPGQKIVTFAVGRGDQPETTLSIDIEFECSGGRIRAGEKVSKAFHEEIDALVAKMNQLSIPDQPGRLSQTSDMYSLFRNRVQGCIREGPRLPITAWMASTSINMDPACAIDNAYKFATLFISGHGISGEQVALSTAAGMITSILAGDVYVTDVSREGVDVDTYSSPKTNLCEGCPCSDCEDKTKAILDMFEFIQQNIGSATKVPDDVKEIFSSGKYDVVMISSILTQTTDYSFNDKKPHGHMFPLLVPTDWVEWVMAASCSSDDPRRTHVDILGKMDATTRSYPWARFATLETVQQVLPVSHTIPHEQPVFFERVSHYHRTGTAILEHYGRCHMFATKKKICVFMGDASKHPRVLDLLEGNSRCTMAVTRTVLDVPEPSPDFDAMACSKPSVVEELRTTMRGSIIGNTSRMCWISKFALKFVERDPRFSRKLDRARIATGPAGCGVFCYE